MMDGRVFCAFFLWVCWFRWFSTVAGDFCVGKREKKNNKKKTSLKERMLDFEFRSET